MVQIIWLEEAKDDLKDIFEFIARDSKRYAQLQIEKLYDRTMILKDHIRAGKLVEELGNEKIRELIEGRYRIIYRINNESSVHILMIHHSARDLAGRLRRKKRSV